MVSSPLEELSQMWSIQAAFPWQVIALIMVGLSFAIVAIIYMLARIFNSDRLKKIAYSEFLTALGTLIIVGMLIGLITIISNITFNLSMEMARINSPAYYELLKQELGQHTITQDIVHFFPAQHYVNSISRCVRQLYIINFCSGLIIEPMAEMAESITGSDKIGAALPVVVVRNMLRTYATTLTTLLYTTYIQKHLLLLIQQVALTIFLPIGIVLRAFPLTRGAGNTFIALSIGAYFVYPLGYSILLMISTTPEGFQNKCGVSVQQGVPSPAEGCVAAFGKSTLLSSALLVPTLGLDKLLSATGIGKFFTLSGLRGLAIGTAVGLPAILSFVNQIQPLIVEVLIYTVVQPFIVVAVTLTFVKSFATFLGADVQDMVQGLIRII